MVLHAFFRHCRCSIKLHQSCMLVLPCQGPAATAAAAGGNTGHSTRSRNLSQLSSQASHQLEVYQAQHAAVVADVAAVLQQLGLRPGVGCVVGDDVTTIDLGVIAGDPPRQLAIDIMPRPEDLQQPAPGSQPPPSAAAGSRHADEQPQNLSSMDTRPHSNSSSSSGGDGGGGGEQHQPKPVHQYAAARVRRQLLASYGWVSVQVPLVEWVSVMQEDHQRQAPQGQAQHSGRAPAVDSMRHRYLELAVAEAVEQQQQQLQHGHHHHHHPDGEACGPSCSH